MRNQRAALNLPKPTPLEERFWQTVEKGSACWEWRGKRFPNGYGSFFATLSGKRRYLLAHREAWRFSFGSIPDGQLVLHRCDNPPCCNPEHLFLGTTQDNVNDKVRKGRARGAVGMASGNAVLTDDIVREMRRVHREEGIGKRKLAARHGVSESTAHAILRNKTWLHILGRDDQSVAMGLGTTIMTDHEVLEMRRLYKESKVSQARLAEKFGVSKTTVSFIVRGMSWKHLL